MKWLVQMQCLTNVKKAKLKEIEQLGKNKNSQSQKKKKAASTKADRSKKLIIPDGGIPLTRKEIKAMNPKTLKAHLTSRGLATQGNKKELIARLLEDAVPKEENQ